MKIEVDLVSAKNDAQGKEQIFKLLLKVANNELSIDEYFNQIESGDLTMDIIDPDCTFSKYITVDGESLIPCDFCFDSFDFRGHEAETIIRYAIKLIKQSRPNLPVFANIAYGRKFFATESRKAEIEFELKIFFKDDELKVGKSSSYYFMS